MSDPVPRLLKLLPSHRLEPILRRTRLRTFEAGEILFLTDDRTEYLFVLLGGMVKLCAREVNGREVTLALATRGDHLGLAAAATSGHHLQDAICLTSCEAIAIPAEIWIETALDYLRSTRWLLELIGDDLRGLIKTSLERATTHAEERLAACLLQLSDRLGDMKGASTEIEILLPQEELGRLAGSSREVTNRTLMRLRRAGVIDYEPGRLRIFRPDVLERLRCGERAGLPSRSASAVARARSRPS